LWVGSAVELGKGNGEEMTTRQQLAVAAENWFPELIVDIWD
jgi:hypothetical protein